MNSTTAERKAAEREVRIAEIRLSSLVADAPLKDKAEAVARLRAADAALEAIR